MENKVVRRVAVSSIAWLDVFDADAPCDGLDRLPILSRIATFGRPRLDLDSVWSASEENSKPVIDEGVVIGAGMINVALTKRSGVEGANDLQRGMWIVRAAEILKIPLGLGFFRLLLPGVPRRQQRNHSTVAVPRDQRRFELGLMLF